MFKEPESPPSFGKHETGPAGSNTTTYPAALCQSWHTDSTSRISIVLAGELVEETSYSSIVAGPLDMVVKSHRTRHENRYGQSGAKLFSMAIDPDWLSISPSAGERVDWVWLQARQSCHLVISMLEAAAQNDPQCLRSLAIEAIESATIAEFPIKKKQSLRRELQSLRELIHSDAKQTIDVVAAAREIGLHPVYLARAYRETYGISIQENRQLRRVKLGADLLLMTDKTIADVALELNFFDQSHFSRTFKRCTGTTPAKYRSQMTNYFS